MNLFSEFRILLIGILWILVGASEVYAFSMGDLHVQSKFGEKFNASFEINLDFDGPVEVALGDADDYRKLGLDRQDIVDALVADTAVSGDGLRRTVQIRSNNPLFFPSFNLVVRATHNGGTLLESFLVTVDFQQSLALNVRQDKNKVPKVRNKKPEMVQDKVSRSAELVPVVEALPSPPKEDRVADGVSSRSPELEKVEAPSPKEQEVLAGVESVSKTPESPVEDLKIDAQPIVPVSPKSQVVNRRRMSGVIWAYPRPIITIPSLPDKPSPETKTILASKPDTAVSSAVKAESGESQGMASSHEQYVLKKGEGLFAVSKKLKVENYHPAQIAVAIWMNNIDKFIFGNINGIREGVEVDLENLEERLANIDRVTARNILKSQLAEWKLARSVTPVEAEDSEKVVREVPLPTERLEGITDLFEQVNGWQATWQNMDTEGHLSYYESLEKENQTLDRKKIFLSRNSKTRIATSSKILTLQEGVPLVFFEQRLFSETLKSQGLKELEWTRSHSSWKISTENFYEHLFVQEDLVSQVNKAGHVDAEIALNLPFVIHVSSHPDEFSAVSLTNQLRERGFDAYWVPVNIFRDSQIYRVYVGRFSDWEQAQRVVQVLRKTGLGGHATAIPYPFALQVGEVVATMTEARILLESLRQSGLSGMLLVSYGSRGISFRVLVGAYKKAGNASWMFQYLKKSGFSAKLISL